MLAEFGVSGDITFFQNDVLSDKDMMMIIKSLRVKWTVFNELHKKYFDGKTKEGKSELSRTLKQIGRPKVAPQG